MLCMSMYITKLRVRTFSLHESDRDEDNLLLIILNTRSVDEIHFLLLLIVLASTRFEAAMPLLVGTVPKRSENQTCLP